MYQSYEAGWTYSHHQQSRSRTAHANHSNTPCVTPIKLAVLDTPELQWLSISFNHRMMLSFSCHHVEHEEGFRVFAPLSALRSAKSLVGRLQGRDPMDEALLLRATFLAPTLRIP